jgi:3'(2'), 5'-bisphosphate nucleotidase
MMIYTEKDIKVYGFGKVTVMNLEKELEVSKKAAIEAGYAIMDVYNNAEDMEITYKDGHMPLTAADKAANRIIVKALREAFPDYAILSEEEKDDLSRLDNDYCFIVDPLDGTKEFIKRNGQFTVNIALSYQHRSIMGVIYVPVTGELYYAAQGQGAYLDHQDKTGIKLRVSDCTAMSELRMVMSSSHGSEKMERLLKKYNITNFVKMGSSLKGCVVAKGEAELYYRFNPTMEWDTAAMQCITEEAGAIFRQMDDTPMLYNREDSLNAKGFYIINSLENKLEVE